MQQGTLARWHRIHGVHVFHAHLLTLLALSAAGENTPLRPMAERMGIRLGNSHRLKLALGSGVVVDTNPTALPAAEYGRALMQRTTARLSSPGVGIFVAPALAWTFARRNVRAELDAAAVASFITYVAPGTGPTIAGTNLPRPFATHALQARPMLDASLKGELSWEMTRRQQIAVRPLVARVSSPVPDLLGTTLARTTFSNAASWTLADRRRRWRGGVDVGARLDVMDDLTADVRRWRPPGKWQAPPVFIGGFGVMAGGRLLRDMQERGTIEARVGVGATLTSNSRRMVSAAMPLTAAVRWTSRPTGGMTLRAEAGAWVPGTLCPQAWLRRCNERPSERFREFRGAAVPSTPGLLAWAPFPVGLLQLDRQIGVSWSVGVRASMDGRSTLNHTFVHEKRIGAFAVGQVTRTLQLRLSSSLAELSYGPQLDPSFSRSEFAKVRDSRAASVLMNLGRQDGEWAADAGLRWAIRPWLVLLFQQTVLAVVTSVETRSWDGSWQNPGLVRGRTGASLLLQW